MSEIVPASTAATEVQPPEAMILDGMIWTYQDYCDLPSDGKVYQVVGGKLIVAPAPTTTHQTVSSQLFRLLMNHVRENRLGRVLYAPVDVIFSNTDVVQPDVLFVSNARSQLIQERGIAGPPDLIIEILSPSTEMIDKESKRILYERRGVREYLIVHPQEWTVEQYHLRQGHYRWVGIFTEEDTLSLKTIEGLEIPLKEVFEI